LLCGNPTLGDSLLERQQSPQALEECPGRFIDHLAELTHKLANPLTIQRRDVLV
jgi:hypothetical protein